MPGSIGKYNIVREIGRGGFARVYEAFDATVNRRVAVKVLSSIGTDPDMFTRFRNEASAAGNLRHKNIITIYEYGEHEGAPFIAMEYLEGEDLQQIIKTPRPLTILEKVDIMTQVAEGLQYAHLNGVAHRDIKPANIKVQPDGAVKIMDFGIARLLHQDTDRITRDGNVIGTVSYLAPESFTGQDSGNLADIFAYGEMFY